MGRAPCCDKANVKKGPWSPEEDATLKSYIEENGTGGNWIALPQKIVGLKRCGKSCRLRWLNYLRPNLKHGGFSEEEDRIICSLYVSIGSRWSIIAAQLPGRTDNDIKNYWNTRLKKKLLGKQRKEHDHHSSMGRRSKRLPLDGNNNVNHLVGLPNSTFNIIPSSNQVMIPYWPTPDPYLHPIPTITTTATTTASSTTDGFNDNSSVRSLLMKLGGRLTDGCDQAAYYNHHHNQQQQQGLVDYCANIPQISNQMMNMLPLDVDIGGQLMTSEYNLEACITQSTTTFPVELEELMSSNPVTHRMINGQDFMAWGGMTMINNNATGSETSCGESRGSWGEMSSFVSIPMGSGNCDQGLMMPAADHAFDELRYTGVQ